MHLTKVVVLILLLAGCSKPEQIDVPDNLNEIANGEEITAQFKTYSSARNRAFIDAVQALSDAITNFLDVPDEIRLEQARTSWLAAHEAFSYAQFGLLIDPESSNDLLFQIDAWPIQPGYIDNLPEYPTSGIVFDETLEITPDNLLKQHGFSDDEEVVLGLHALELLLFTRDISDFIVTVDNASIKTRRRTLLQLMNNQLRSDAELIVAQSERFTMELENNVLLHLMLKQTLDKIRVIYQESNLIAAQGNGHALSQDRSLGILVNELDALHHLMVSEVNFAASFRNQAPATYNNFLITLERAREMTQAPVSDQLAKAELPLVLAALTHQLEAFVNLNRG